MIVKILPLLTAATAIYGSTIATTVRTTTVSSATARRYSIEDKLSLIGSLSQEKNTDEQAEMINILQFYTRSTAEELLKHPNTNYFSAAKRVLTLLRKNASNPFHLLVSNDNIYGGKRVDVEMLADVIGSICDKLLIVLRRRNDSENEGNGKESNNSKDGEKRIDKAEINRIVEEIRNVGKQFLIIYEKENPYFTSGIVMNFLNTISYIENATEKMLAIDAYLSQIMTRDQFVIVVTNLRPCHAIPNAIHRRAGQEEFGKRINHHLIVIRTANVTKPFQWVNMEPGASSITRLFHCNWEKSDAFFQAMTDIHATSAVLLMGDPNKKSKFIETKVMNSNIQRRDDIPGWSINGQQYADYLKNDELKGLVGSMRHHTVVLCF